MQAHIVEEDKMSNFDTLKYSKRAIEAGFTEKQAEFQAEEMGKIINDHIATKGDIRDLQSDLIKVKLELKNDLSKVKSELSVDLSKLRSELSNDLSKVRSELKNDLSKLELEIKGEFKIIRLEINSLENRLILKMGAMMAVSMGILTTILKIF